MSAPEWMLLDQTQDVARCEAKAGLRGSVRCEMPEGHNGIPAGALFHCGRAADGRWKSWPINKGDTSDAKLCTKCGEVKPLSGFTSRGDGTGRVRSICIECDQERQGQYREASEEWWHERSRQWRTANLEHAREYGRSWHMANRSHHNEARRLWREANLQQDTERQERRNEALRTAVFGHYGRECACCGSTAALTIDHINGDGAAHRLALSRGGGVPFYFWLIESGFPEGFQTLCVSCNSSKAAGTRCSLEHAEKVSA